MTRGIVAAVLLLGATAVPGAAADGAPIAVTPAVGEVSVLPGAPVTESVTLTNSATEALTVLAAVGDVSPSGDGFELRTPGSTADSAAAWVTVTPSSVTLEPGGSAIATVTVRAPKGSLFGEHAAGVLFSAGRQAQALHTVLATVAGGGLRREARVASIEMPAFETRDRILFRISVDNTGNTHAVVRGTITIRDWLRRSDTSIEIPTLYAMPGRTSRFVLEWKDPPPILLARATAHVSLRYESPSGPAVAQSVTTTGVAIVYWALALLVALVLLVIRLLIGLFGRRRRRAGRARRERAAGRIPAGPKPTTGADLPPPVPGAPVRAGRSAWAGEPLHNAAAGAIAVRRTHAAIALLREGAGRSGVRADVAVGLLRGVQDLPEVRREVEAAYEDAVQRKAAGEAGALALGLAVVDSPHAPEALLRAYAKSDRVLAARLRRALAACDPADLRSNPDLLEALPRARRETLPAG